MMQLATCGLCQLQVPQNNTVSAQIPIHNPQSDSLKLALKKLCKGCHSIISQIEQFASHHQIKYCDPQFKAQSLQGMKGVLPQPRPLIQQLYTSSNSFAQNQRNRSNSDGKSKLTKRFPQTQQLISENQQEQPIHPYVALIVQQVKNKNLLCLSNLPKTLQLLIHLAEKQSIKGFVISPQERREKLKNIVLFLAERIHLSLEQLPYIMVFTNFLLCFMDPAKATSIMIYVSDILVTYSHLISWKTLILQQEKCISKNPLSPASVDMRAVVLKVQKLWLRVQSVLQLSRRGELVLNEGLVRISKLQIIDYKQNRKRLAQILKPLLLKKQEKEQMSVQRLNLLYLVKLQRNGYSIILKNMLQTEEQIKQEMNQIANRFKKEKQEYIQKIVKLSNKIEELQAKIVKLQSKNTYEINQFSSFIEKTQAVEEVKQVVQLQQPNNPQFAALQDIISLTSIITFNQKHIGSNKNTANCQKIEDFTKCIIEEIQRLKQAYQKLLVRSNHNEDEKNRLLGIVSRKDDRFISVITEKDVIIQRYEQALWRMENGLEVQEQPLSHRIRYIIHIFNKKRVSELRESLVEPGDKIVRRESKQCQIY